MTEATCSVLAQILPVLLLVSVIEVRVIRPKVRRIRWVRWVVTAGFGCSFIGLVATVIGVQANGVPGGFAAVAIWTVVAVAVIAFFLIAALITASIEIEADEAE